MRLTSSKGFTLIEILMVLILIAILAAVGVNSFVDFRDKAREAALRSNLSALRAAISSHTAQLILRCGSDAASFPKAASIAGNDITTGSSGCTTGEVSAENRRFTQGGVPQNPWSSTATTVTACTTTGCNKADGTNCTGGATTGSDNWCYNEATGDIWLDRDTYKSY